MPEIPNITSTDIVINDIEVPSIQTLVNDFSVNSYGVLSPPVVIEIGTPIVNMPGCVEAHEINEKDNFNINEDDPKGVKTFCDAGTPSFDPISYEPENLVPTGERETPEVKTGEPKKKETKTETFTPKSEVPVTPPSTAEIECPTQEQISKEPIGFVFDSGRKVITGYKLEGTQCIRLVEDVPIIQQAINGLPPTETVITTGGIAVVATTSALLAKPFADILLKVIKPAVKKVLKKVAAIRGKQLKILSVEERRAEQRDRNQAIAKLKSVQTKTKKKG